jgi:hypothetical protein
VRRRRVLSLVFCALAIAGAVASGFYATPSRRVESHPAGLTAPQIARPGLRLVLVDARCHISPYVSQTELSRLVAECYRRIIKVPTHTARHSRLAGYGVSAGRPAGKGLSRSRKAEGLEVDPVVRQLTTRVSRDCAMSDRHFDIGEERPHSFSSVSVRNPAWHPREVRRPLRAPTGGPSQRTCGLRPRGRLSKPRRLSCDSRGEVAEWLKAAPC